MTRWLLVRFVFCFASLALVPSPLGAQEAEEIAPEAAEAQALFRRAVELGEQDRWAEALELFRRSRALVDRPSTVFNIAYALHRLGRYTLAIESFDAYVAATEGEESERRSEAIRLRGEAAASLAEIDLELVPDDAAVMLDGQRLPDRGAQRRLVLDPGRHVVLASAPGFADGELEISVLAGERGSRRLSLEPDAASGGGGGGGGGEDPGTTSPGGGSIAEEPLFWVALIGGVLLVGGAVTAVVLVTTSESPQPYGGSTGVVLEGLRF